MDSHRLSTFGFGSLLEMAEGLKVVVGVGAFRGFHASCREGRRIGASTLLSRRAVDMAGAAGSASGGAALVASRHKRPRYIQANIIYIYIYVRICLHVLCCTEKSYLNKSSIRSASGRIRFTCELWLRIRFRMRLLLQRGWAPGHRSLRIRVRTRPRIRSRMRLPHKTREALGRAQRELTARSD